MVRYMIQRLYFIRVYCAMLPKSFVSGIYGFLWITQINLSIFVDLHSIHPRSSLVRCCVSLSHCELVNCVLFLFFQLLPDSISILVTKKPLLSSQMGTQQENYRTEYVLQNTKGLLVALCVQKHVCVRRFDNLEPGRSRLIAEAPARQVEMTFCPPTWMQLKLWETQDVLLEKEFCSETFANQGIQGKLDFKNRPGK